MMDSCILPIKKISQEVLSVIDKEIIPKINKLSDKNSFLDLLKNIKWGYYFNEDILMFHAPVGNIELLKNSNNVEIIISGFCVSPEAGLLFLRDYKKYNNYEEALADNAFNSSDLRESILGMLCALYKYNIILKEYKDAFALLKENNMNVVFTQTLCPIAVKLSEKINYKWKWNSIKVWEMIHIDGKLKEYAENSLKEWYDNIIKIKGDNIKLLILGKGKYNSIDCYVKDKSCFLKYNASEALKLLMCSKLISNNRIKIEKELIEDSIFDRLKEKFKNNIYSIPHPSRYTKERESRFIRELREFNKK